MKHFILAITLLFSLNSFGVQTVKKGEEVPHDGVLFTHKEEKELRKTNEQKIRLEDLRIQQDEVIKIQQQRIDNYKVYYDETKNQRSLTKWEKVLYFTGGVVASGLLIYTTSKIMHNVGR